MDEFKTRETANEGIKLPLNKPTGEKTEHFLVLRSVDSDAYQMQYGREKRNMGNIKLQLEEMVSEDEKSEFLVQTYRESEIRLWASLIKDWSFDKECTFDNVVEFLTDAPQIGDQINVLSTKRALFFKGGQDS